MDNMKVLPHIRWLLLNCTSFTIVLVMSAGSQQVKSTTFSFDYNVEYFAHVIVVLRIGMAP